jgi:hypothetical protein
MCLYLIRRAAPLPDLSGRWDGPAWGSAPVLTIDRFHARSSGHRPRTEARLVHGDEALYALFRVDDRYVRSIHTEYESDTYKDSCVELFVQPGGGGAYFALEVNCGGAFSLRYIEDPTRTSNRFARWRAVSPGDAAGLRVAHSMPDRVDPEVTDPVSWWVEVALPWRVLEPYCGPIGTLSGQRWRGNLFKCGDETSHPHWASWAPIGEELNFHQPRYFGGLDFE